VIEYLTETYGAIQVSWLPELDGGGRSFGQAFVPIVKDLFGNVDRVYEFCSGPAFIGFSLLAHGLCKSLCLSDVNPKAIAAVKDTIRRNHLGDRVNVYLSDGLLGIPHHEKWDLVVSNPPHFEVSTEAEYASNIRLNDRNWAIHRAFYSTVGKHLKPGGSILMQENHMGSDEGTFIGMIEVGDLAFIDSFMYDNRHAGIVDPYFYFWCQKKAERRKVWRQGHTRFVFGNPEIKRIEVTGIDHALSNITMRTATQYKLNIVNGTMDPLEIVIFKKRHAILWRQATSTILNVPPSRIMTSGTFCFGEGRYHVRDLRTGRILSALSVS